MGGHRAGSVVGVRAFERRIWDATMKSENWNTGAGAAGLPAGVRERPLGPAGGI